MKTIRKFGIAVGYIYVILYIMRHPKIMTTNNTDVSNCFLYLLIKFLSYCVF